MGIKSIEWIDGGRVLLVETSAGVELRMGFETRADKARLARHPMDSELVSGALNDRGWEPPSLNAWAACPAEPKRH